jgi:hypothetical protein
MEASPKEPNGDMVTIQVRQAQMTRQGIRESVATQYGLDSAKQVKQFAHVITLGPRIFYERIDTKASLGKLDDGDMIVWSQVQCLSLSCTQCQNTPIFENGLGKDGLSFYRNPHKRLED